MKISITGANGFLGRHFVKNALEEGHTISALVGPGEVSLPSTNNLKLIRGTLENTNNEALEVLDDTEVFVHMAAIGVQSRDRNWDDMITVNCTQPLKWLDSAREVGVKKVIAIGTALEYEGFGDLPGTNPYPNGDYPRCNEISSLECNDPYGATKAAGGLMLRSYAKSIDMPLTYLRLASMYGPKDDPRKLIPSAIHAAKNKLPFPMSPGEQVRDWLHVDDAIGAILTAAQTESSITSIFNIGTGKGISIKKLIEHIFDKFQAPKSLIQPDAYPYRKNEKRYLVLSCQGAQNEYQWSSTQDINNDTF